jgi:hypothetical protein
LGIAKSILDEERDAVEEAFMKGSGWEFNDNVQEHGSIGKEMTSSGLIIEEMDVDRRAVVLTLSIAHENDYNGQRRRGQVESQNMFQGIKGDLQKG